MEKSHGFAQRGFRSLGVAVKEEGEPWRCLGLLPMFDPPREDTAMASRLLFTKRIHRAHLIIYRRSVKPTSWGSKLKCLQAMLLP